MTLISLSFTPEMEQAILDGRKWCTTRRTKHGSGNRGDTFLVSGRLYRLYLVYRLALHAVTYGIYHYEGFNSPEEFIKFWETNVEPYNGNEQVWIHYFEPVPEVDA